MKKKKPSLRNPIVCATYDQLEQAIVSRLTKVYLEDSKFICTVINLTVKSNSSFELSLKGREIKVAQTFNEQQIDRAIERAYDNFFKDRHLPYYPFMIEFQKNLIFVFLVTVH